VAGGTANPFLSDRYTSFCMSLFQVTQRATFLRVVIYLSKYISGRLIGRACSEDSNLLPCDAVFIGKYRSFGCTCCLHLQGRVLFTLKIESTGWFEKSVIIYWTTLKMEAASTTEKSVSTNLHVVMPQKTWFFTNTAVLTSDLASCASLVNRTNLWERQDSGRTECEDLCILECDAV
jgi:hypothetical protein